MSRKLELNQDSLVEQLQENGFVKSIEVERVMRKVDRKFFCNEKPYEDVPIKIGFAATISAPHMHAICLESLKDHMKEGSKVLDVGCGSGYLTACFAMMVGDKGSVIGVEHIPELIQRAIKNINAFDKKLMKNIKIVEADGRDGYKDGAPYDAIHVGAAAFEIPDSLIRQLRVGGRLVLPVVDRLLGTQRLTVVDKRADEVLSQRALMNVRYVPLVSVEAQMTNVMDDAGVTGHGTIDMLNDDTLLTIFEYLTHREWLILESVCRRWHLLIRQHWKCLKLIELYELLGVKPFASCDVQYFTPTITEKLIRGLADRCPKVLGELVVGCRAKMHLNCLNILAVNFVNLTSLDISKTALIDPDDAGSGSSFEMSSVFGSLKNFNLQSCFDDSVLSYYEFETVDHILFKLFSSMPHVENVNLGHNTMLNGSCLLSLSTTIQSLDLSFCRRINGETLMLAFSSLPNLRHVSLYSNNRLAGTCLSFLPGALESVDLSFCDSLEPEMLKHFVVTHKELRNLQMSHVKGLSNAVLERIAALEHLETLNLNSYFKTSYYEQHQHPTEITKGLKYLHTMETLKSLDLSKNDFVNDAVLIGFGYGKCELEELNVSQVCNVGPVGFASLGRQSKLKRLDISCNECVDDTVLLSVSHGGSLEFVNARKCDQVTEATLKRLSGFWPNNITVFQVY